MLCPPSGVCGCAFESVGLQIAVGGQGQILIEPAGPGIVALKSSVTTPFLGQTIYETTTARLWVYDGTNWVIYGGVMPAISMYDGTAVDQAIANAVTTTITLSAAGAVEVYDTDGFRGSSSNLFTIPAGLGGDYVAEGYLVWAAPSIVAGAWYNRLQTGNNTGVTDISIIDDIRVPAAGVTLAAQNARTFRLRAAATVSLQAFQNSGASTNVTAWAFALRMVRHIPSLV